MTKRKFSLRKKILIAMALASLLPIAIISVFAISQQYQRLMEQHQKFQRAALQITLNGMMLFMKDEHCGNMSEQLVGIKRGTYIQSVRILDLNGQIRHSSAPIEVGQIDRDIHRFAVEKSFPNTNEYTYTDKKKKQMTITTRIPNSERCITCHNNSNDYIGYISVVGDLSSIHQEMWIHIRYDLIVTVAIFLAVSITISIIHLRYVQDNIKIMNDAIKEVEQGNFEKHIPINPSEELGRLSVSFNEMIDRLNAMRKELKKAHQQELERAEKLANIGELSASMAHEIKNPIAGISGAMDVLLSETSENDPNRPIFEEILVQTQRIDRAVNSLLAFSKPRDPIFKECRIDQIIQQASQFTLQKAKHDGIETEVIFNPETPPALLDCEQIEQVLVNLILNAIQAMPNGGKLSIIQEYHPQDEKVIIRVRDNGVGIEPEKLRVIFKPFYTTKPNGTGLGLAICKNIIDLHQGTIEVESTPQVGTTFTIKLPLKPNLNSF